MNLHRERSFVLPLCTAVLLMAQSFTARALSPVPVPLGDLIAQSDLIIIGVVVAVGPGAGPGKQLADIVVEEAPPGTIPPVGPPTVTLEGDVLDATAPTFAVGTQILAFLREAAPVPPGEVEFEPVEGGIGITEIPPGSLDVTRAIMEKALTLGNALALSDLVSELKHTTPPPPSGLLAPVLEEVQPKLTAADEALVTEVACDTDDAFVTGVHLWGIHRAADLGFLSARACLDEIAVHDSALAEQIAAVEALGDLGDKKSVKALLSLLPDGKKCKDEDSAEGNECEAAAGEVDKAEGGLLVSIVLALGRIGDDKAVKKLGRLAQSGDNLELDTTVVHALGLIGGKKAAKALEQIEKGHPNPAVRDQAGRTLERLS